MRIVDKPCKHCGVMMYGVSSLKTVCDECLHKKNLERQRRARERNQQRKTEQEAQREEELQEKKPQPSQLDVDACEATRCGLTYGQLKLRTAHR